MLAHPIVIFVEVLLSSVETAVCLWRLNVLGLSLRVARRASKGGGR